MISVLTPIRKEEECADDLSTQTVDCHRFVHSCELTDRRENEAFNRERLKTYASYPYTLLLDADVVFDEPTTVEQMIHLLDVFPFGGVAVDTKKRNDGQLCRDSDVGHTVIACLMIRKELLDAVIFLPLDFLAVDDEVRKLICMRAEPAGQKCVCRRVNAQVRAMTGYPIPYLRNVKAREV